MVFMSLLAVLLRCCAAVAARLAWGGGVISDRSKCFTSPAMPSPGPPVSRAACTHVTYAASRDTRQMPFAQARTSPTVVIFSRTALKFCSSAPGPTASLFINKKNCECVVNCCYLFFSRFLFLFKQKT